MYNGFHLKTQKNTMKTNKKNIKETKDIVHSFFVEDAKKYGVPEAVILYNIRFWLRKNVANQKNIYKNRVWTYNSMESFVALFPYLTIDKVKNHVKKLTESGILMKENFNKKKYDRTNWYSINEEEFCKIWLKTSSGENAQSRGEKYPIEGGKIHHASGENTRPIPDSNTYGNTYLAISGEIAQNEKTHVSSKKDKKTNENEIENESSVFLTKEKKDVVIKKEDSEGVKLNKAIELFKEVFPVEFSSKSNPYTKKTTRQVVQEVLKVYTHEELKKIISEYQKHKGKEFYAGVSMNVYEFCKKIEKIVESNNKFESKEEAPLISLEVEPGEIEKVELLGKLTHDLETPLLDAVALDVMAKYKVTKHPFSFVRKLVYLLAISHVKFNPEAKDDEMREIYWAGVDTGMTGCLEDGLWYGNENAEAGLWDKKIFEI